MRAYGSAAAAVLADAPIGERPVLTTLSLAHDYELSAAVETVLAAHGASLVDADYGARVSARVKVPRASADAFVAAMTEATAGRVTPS